MKKLINRFLIYKEIECNSQDEYGVGDFIKWLSLRFLLILIPLLSISLLIELYT